jgi:YVTN family beta-propeller protein
MANKNVSSRAWIFALWVALSLASPRLTSAQIASPNKSRDSNIIATVRAGKAPGSLAINSVTNKIYVANTDGKSVTVIDGAGNTSETVKLPDNPALIAVNSATNKIYVTSWRGKNIWVIDGTTNTMTTVPTGWLAGDMAVNRVTNKIYVTHMLGNGVTVIDGAANTTTRVATGSANTVVVNPVTNKIYVSCETESGERRGTVTVIDGATNATTTITVGWSPGAMAVDSITDKIYVINFAHEPPRGIRRIQSVAVIDGATNAITSVDVGIGARGIAVNPETNKIFVANCDSDDVTVIDGATNATRVMHIGPCPTGVTINSTTNKIFVAHSYIPDATRQFPFDSRGLINGASNDLTVIDGTSYGITTARIPARNIAVNPETNRIYMTNVHSEDVTVMDCASMNSGGIVMIDAKAASSH